MKKVRAKFKCESIETTEWSKNVKFSAVIGTQGENKDFSDATPSGSLEIGISGKVPAADFFTPGKQYYLDFTESL